MADYFPPPDREGGWRTLTDLDAVYRISGSAYGGGVVAGSDSEVV